MGVALIAWGAALSKNRIKNPANRGRVKEDGGYITFVRQA